MGGISRAKSGAFFEKRKIGENRKGHASKEADKRTKINKAEGQREANPRRRGHNKKLLRRTFTPQILRISPLRSNEKYPVTREFPVVSPPFSEGPARHAACLLICNPLPTSETMKPQIL
jgi:hypothetical protein